MRIAVIGAAGAMGSFFARYFQSRGETVVGWDIRPIGLRGVAIASSRARAAEDSDAVLVATPMKTTAEVCRSVSAHMKAGSLLVEISSVKGTMLPKLKSIAEKHHVRLLSVHPLFGPSQQRYAGMRMAVIKDSGFNMMSDAKRLFPDANLIPIESEAHDRLMAVMLSLTHLINIAFAQVVAETVSPSSFLKISTPSSALQCLLAEAVLSQDPSLCADIQSTNKYTSWAVKKMARTILKLNGMVEGGQRTAFSAEFRRLSRLFSADDSSMRKVYLAYDVLA